MTVQLPDMAPAGGVNPATAVDCSIGTCVSIPVMGTCSAGELVSLPPPKNWLYRKYRPIKTIATITTHEGNLTPPLRLPPELGSQLPPPDDGLKPPPVPPPPWSRRTGASARPSGPEPLRLRCASISSEKADGLGNTCKVGNKRDALSLFRIGFAILPRLYENMVGLFHCNFLILVLIRHYDIQKYYKLFLFHSGNHRGVESSDIMLKKIHISL
jgi:hypothetical protein